MEWIPLNFTIMKNPFNWIIVTLMVLIAGLALHLIVNPGAARPETGETEQ